MEAFLLAFSQRVISGLQNGFGYSKRTNYLHLMGIALLAFPLFSFQSHWVFFLFIILYPIIVFFKTISFTTKSPSLNKWKDIHFWENLTTGSYFLFLILSNYNILLLLCSVYPALILHKGFINLGSGLPFFAEQTDDPSGKTYSIPLLNIKIKRSSTSFRLLLAILSLIILYFILTLNITFYIFVK